VRYAERMRSFSPLAGRKVGMRGRLRILKINDSLRRPLTPTLSP
jgi:hypothetical protein